MEKLLQIEHLNASVNNTPIIKNFNLIINEHEVHVIMGPNGCGKSTLSKVLAGHPSYEVTNGKVIFSNNLISVDGDVNLNISNKFIPGIYLIKYKTAHEESVEKMIVQ